MFSSEITKDRFNDFTDSELKFYLSVLDYESFKSLGKIPSHKLREYCLVHIVYCIFKKRILNLKIMTEKQFMNATNEIRNNNQTKVVLSYNSFPEVQIESGLVTNLIGQSIMSALGLDAKMSSKVDWLIENNKDFNFAPFLSTYNHEINSSIVMNYYIDLDHGLPENAQTNIDRYCMYEALTKNLNYTALQKEIDNLILDNTESVYNRNEN